MQDTQKCLATLQPVFHGNLSTERISLWSGLL